MQKLDFSFEASSPWKAIAKTLSRLSRPRCRAQTHSQLAFDARRQRQRERCGQDVRRQLGARQTAGCVPGAGDDAVVDAVNSVIAESAADWIAILPCGIILSPNALSSVARAAAANPDTRLIYSDDDRIDPETMQRWNPFFKPDWSPDLLSSMNYLGPFVVFHRQTVLEVGGLRHGVPGAEVYDLALRVTERSARSSRARRSGDHHRHRSWIPGRHGTLQIGGRRNARHSRMHSRGARWTARWSEASTPALASPLRVA